MRSRFFFLLAVCWAPTSWAGSWQFAPPIEADPIQGAKVFHHLESAGRKNIALSGDTVALVWEDNRSGAPQIYVATKRAYVNTFTPPRRLSAGKSAYEPVIAALADGKFIVAWEQDEGIWARMVTASIPLAPAVQLTSAGSAHVSLAMAMDGSIHAVWAQRLQKFRQIQFAELHLAGATVKMASPPRAVDAQPPLGDQLYPSIATTPRGVVVAWEDRRHGHTILLYSYTIGKQKFSSPTVLNEQPPRMSAIYGKGFGAARVTLASRGGNKVAAAWLDKRDFTTGYDVYAAFAKQGTEFGPNQKVQDGFGNAISQWHVAVAMSEYRVVVAWDDDRDDTADLWLAWSAKGTWSENETIAGAAGPGLQHSPVVAFDRDGGLHVAWIDQTQADGPTRIMYTRGRLSKMSTGADIEKKASSGKISAP